MSGSPITTTLFVPCRNILLYDRLGIRGVVCQNLDAVHVEAYWLDCQNSSLSGIGPYPSLKNEELFNIKKSRFWDDSVDLWMGYTVSRV